MKCVEYFYKEATAIELIDELNKMDYEADPELVISVDEEADEKVYIVYYNPRPIK